MRALTFLLLTLLIPALGLAGPIYKTYDEEGNPVYTDQEPDDDAEPMDLPELNVLEEREGPPAELIEEQPAQEAEALELVFESPVPGQDLVTTDSTLPVELSSNVSLPDSTFMVVYLNGEQRPAVPGLAADFEEVPAGENTIRAEVQTESGRVLASTEEVTFTMHHAAGREQEPD